MTFVLEDRQDGVEGGGGQQVGVRDKRGEEDEEQVEPGITTIDEVGGRYIKVVMDRILEVQEDITGGSEGDGGDSEFTLGKKEDDWGNKRITEVRKDVGSFEGQDRFEKAISDTPMCRK